MRASKMIVRITISLVVASSVIPHATLCSADAIKDLPTIDPSKVLDQALANARFPDRASLHLQISLKYAQRRLQDGITGESFSFNICHDHQKLDVAELASMTHGATTKPYLASRDIWDGKQFLHRQQELDVGPAQVRVVYSDSAAQLDRVRPYFDGLFIDGRLPLDDESIPALLRRSGASIIDRNEQLGARQCLLIEGRTRSGLYRIWLDQSDGCRLIKATVVKEKGDAIGSGETLPIKMGTAAITGYEISIHDIEFQRFGGYVVPASGVMDETVHHSDNKDDVIRETAVRSRLLADLDLEPGRFVMDGIPDGMPVTIRDHRPDDHFSYVWKGGHVVKDDEEQLTKDIDKAVDAEKRAAQAEQHRQ